MIENDNALCKPYRFLYPLLLLLLRSKRYTNSTYIYIYIQLFYTYFIVIS